MNTLIKQLPNFDKFNNYIGDVNKKISPIMLSGLVDSSKVHLAYATRFYSEKPICIITYNEMQAKKIIKDLKYFSEDVIFFPKREIVTYDYIAESKDLPYERIDALNKIYDKKAKIIVTTIEAVMQKIVPKEILYKNIIKLKVGDIFNLEELKEKLIYLGYERQELIENKGQFSIRGGIVDVAVSENKGVRIEFWGDEVDSIRYFNISDQRSTEMLDKISIYPAHEFLIDKSLEEITAKIIEKEYKENIKKYVEDDVSLIKNGDYISKIDKYFNSFYEKSDSFIDYLGKDFIIFLDEIGKIRARAVNIIKDNEAVIKSLIEKDRIIPDSIKNIVTYEEIIETLDKKQIIYLEKQDIGFVDKQSMHAKRNGYSFSYREVNFFRSSMDLYFQEIQEAVKSKKYVIVLSGNMNNSQKIAEILTEKEIPNKVVEKLDKDITAGEVIISTGALSSGFESYDFNLLVLTSEELFTVPKPKKKTLSKSFKEGEKVVFADLKVGDFVVHKMHGIGQFIGVNTIKADGITKDYIKIKYKGDDMLYIPTNQLDNIRKYIAGGESLPKVNKLGSKEWENTKSKVKSNLREVARELIELYAKRQKVKGYAYSKDTPWQKQFEDSFEFLETDDQLRCIDEMKKDMEASKPMDRLLCGDVGYGKTEVAIRGAFKAVMDQKQVAYLVPTTVLANQQYESFKKRMEGFAINVEVLNRFKTKKEQENIVKKLKLGQIDVVIGTHRILSKDVEFKDLGMLIIDEEHRFGVKDKEKIKELKTNVDVLTMTATPIPRTLHMSIVGVRDMSVIYEPPQNRKPVQTYVLEYDEEVVKEAITKELEREGQVFYLFNNVEGIIRKAESISELVPEAKVAYAHGKMSGKELEDIMQDFIDKKIDVLVCTTILESGIDIPNANTIIVENGDRLGLAQLYQIRGRVGRAKSQGYAYITYKRDKLISEIADKRLKTIKEFTEFGSGFKIAMRDLEIRGAGSLLGEIQHGHLMQVGYDTYCKLLDEVVKEMQGEVVQQEETDIQIDLNVSSYIPDDFIENSSQKIEIYQNIALCRSEEDIQNIIDEIIDRFGRMPKELENLIDIARIKGLCKKSGITKIMQKRENIVFTFKIETFNMDIVDDLLKEYRNRIKFSQASNPYITLKVENNSEKVIFSEVKEFLKKISI